MAAQVPDKILLEDELKDLYTNPLEQYWILHRKKRPVFCSCDGCRRGYVATWAIQNQELFLKSINGEARKTTLFFGSKLIPYSLKNLFPLAGQKPVKAVWYSGKLRIPIGNMSRFEDNDYDSRFEQDLIITVEQGNVIRTVTLNNAEHALIIHDDQ